jgi:hypothetical protein
MLGFNSYDQERLKCGDLKDQATRGESVAAFILFPLCFVCFVASYFPGNPASLAVMLQQLS